MTKKEIRAVYTDDSIRVYQAYSDKIADEALQIGTFGMSFKRDRMTWIKPSFLWMMYRCGWAEKKNQERVLAIDIKRDAFDYIVENAVLSKYNKDFNGDYEEWKQLIKCSDIRCQWDPERDLYGNPMEYRSIQLGLRGKELQSYVDEWILKINDITDYVKRIKKMRDQRQDITGLLPPERVYRSMAP